MCIQLCLKLKWLLLLKMITSLVSYYSNIVNLSLKILKAQVHFNTFKKQWYNDTFRMMH